MRLDFSNDAHPNLDSRGKGSTILVSVEHVFEPPELVWVTELGLASEKSQVLPFRGSRERVEHGLDHRQMTFDRIWWSSIPAMSGEARLRLTVGKEHQVLWTLTFSMGGVPGRLYTRMSVRRSEWYGPGLPEAEESDTLINIMLPPFSPKLKRPPQPKVVRQSAWERLGD